MLRDAMTDLKAWKDKGQRKPLLLRGARQTGKTWLLKEFGRSEFDSLAYVDLLASSRAREVFNRDFDIPRIVSALSVESGTKIEAGKTLIVLDEIQEAPRALTALKYFCQDAPDYHVAAAGSYLGIAKHEGVSFPVGKVNMLSLEPMSFLEFLDATEEGAAAEALRERGAAGIDPALFGKMEQLLREYLFVGGMPEAVGSFVAERDYSAVREVHNEILDAYDLDFSKHAPARILERMRLVWEGLPAQLAKESKKFVYGAVRPGGRARDFKESIQWLADYGAVRRVSRVSALRVPLLAYRDEGAFKLFCVDVGLLGALSHLQPSVLLEGSRLFTEFRGALTEQYVCQQLVACGMQPAYWSSDTGRAEVDFAVELDGEPVPIEVKAAENLQSKSLKVARDRFELKRCVRASLSGYRDEGWLANIPLWAIASLGSSA
ncbi:MAG: ATP-binding protein [Atopobiaceae bacterium]|nr:ATP-binding protein [Atopobiaceae bacterium]